MTILDGYQTALQLNKTLKKRIKLFKTTSIPTLAIMLIGDNPASLSYIRGKIKAASSVGIETKLIQLDETIDQTTALQTIDSLNQDPQIHAMILQLPIPKHLDKHALIDRISIHKDADGFHTMHQGLLHQSRKTMVPATPLGIMFLLKSYQINVSGLHAVVLGRSNIVGAPIARLLQDSGATVTVCHSKTKHIETYTQKADIIIAALGVPHYLKEDMVKDGVIIIDVGINKVSDHIVGDVDFEHVSKKASFITPVPKGVGPMTIHALLYNTVELYFQHLQNQERGA